MYRIRDHEYLPCQTPCHVDLWYFSRCYLQFFDIACVFVQVLNDQFDLLIAVQEMCLLYEVYYVWQDIYNLLYLSFS